MQWVKFMLSRISKLLFYVCKCTPRSQVPAISVSVYVCGIWHRFECLLINVHPRPVGPKNLVQLAEAAGSEMKNNKNTDDFYRFFF